MTGLVSTEDERALADVQRLSTEAPAKVSELVALFQHRSWAVRRAVVAALARAEAPGIDALASALVHERAHEPTIAGIVDALSLATKDADPKLRALLDRPEPAVLCDAAQIAGRRRDAGAVPRLVELTGHADDNVALAAIEALGRVGGAVAVERLIALVQGSNFFRSFPAVDVLGRTKDPRALPVLERLLAHPLYAVEATRAIGRIGSLAGAAALVRAMESAPEAVVRAAAQGIVAIHEAAEAASGRSTGVSRAIRERAAPGLRDRIVRALVAADAPEAIALGRLLVWLADEDSIDDLVSLLDSSEEMAALAVQGLSNLSALSDSRVLAVLREGTSEQRARLLPALMGATAASPAVAACLSDGVPSVRAMACHVLSRSRDTTSVPRLFELLTDPDAGVSHAAIAAIQSLGSAETERLALASARTENAVLRRAGLRIVTYFAYQGSLELCVEALASDDARLRDVALAGLACLEDPAVPGILVRAARHPFAKTRAAALRAVGHGALTAELEKVLTDALEDEDAWARYYACQSLGKLRVASALPALARLLDDTAEQVKIAAVEALASIPGDQAADALSTAARSENLDVRRAALVGIGERQEPRLRGILSDALASDDATVRLVAVSSVARFDDTEHELAQVAANDADASVRRAAVELLAARKGVTAVNALIDLLGSGRASNDAMVALRNDVDSRIPVILVRLEGAGDALARALLAVLGRAESRAGRQAVEAAFTSKNDLVRRAAARCLSLVLDDAAKALLARAATLDTDAEVRRISAAAIA